MSASNIADNNRYRIGDSVHLNPRLPLTVVERIVNMAELCQARPTPHHHIVTTHGHYCVAISLDGAA